jgi:hypothetical protein
MSRLGRLWSKIEGSNGANCDSSNQQFTHGTLLSSGHGHGFSYRLYHTTLPDLLTRRQGTLRLHNSSHPSRRIFVVSMKTFSAAQATLRIQGKVEDVKGSERRSFLVPASLRGHFK